jgi:hypothetical protein
MSQVSCWSDVNSLVQPMHARFPQNFVKTKPKQRGIIRNDCKTCPIFSGEMRIHGHPLLRASHGHLRENFAWPRHEKKGSHVMDWNGVLVIFLKDSMGFPGIWGVSTFNHFMAWFKGQSMENSHLFHGNHPLRWIPGSTQRNTPGSPKV